MKKILIFILLVCLFLVSAAPKVRADNGVPYQTFTFSRSQRDLVRTQDAYVPLSLAKEIGGHELNNPADIAIDAFENVFIADRGNGRIIKFNPEEDVLAPEIIGAGFLLEPTGVAVDREGNLYVADIGREEAYRYAYDGESGTYELTVTYKRPQDSPCCWRTNRSNPAKSRSTMAGMSSSSFPETSTGSRNIKTTGNSSAISAGTKFPRPSGTSSAFFCSTRTSAGNGSK